MKCPIDLTGVEGLLSCFFKTEPDEKIKVLKGMACAKVVIGSQLSFAGISIHHGPHGIITSTASDYIVQIKSLINNPILKSLPGSHDKEQGESQ